MNKRQRSVLWIAFGAILLTGLSGLLWPTEPHYVYKEIVEYRLDSTKLFFEWLFILLLAGIAFIALRPTRALSESEQIEEDKKNEAKRLLREEKEEASRIKSELRKEQHAIFISHVQEWHRRLIWPAVPIFLVAFAVLPYSLIWRGDTTDGGYSVGSGVGNGEARGSYLGYHLVTTQPSVPQALYSRRNYFSLDEIPKRQKRGYEFLRDSLDSVRGSLNTTLDSLNRAIDWLHSATNRDSIDRIIDSMEGHLNPGPYVNPGPGDMVALSKSKTKIERGKSHWVAVEGRISQDSMIFIRDSLAKEDSNFYNSITAALHAEVKVDFDRASFQIIFATLLLVIAIFGRRSRIEKS
jgi:hypothetical protein